MTNRSTPGSILERGLLVIGDAKVRVMSGFDGVTLRAWRRTRGWDVPELARQLRRAADKADIQIAAHDGLIRMIYAWERGDHEISERYELLFRTVASQATEPAYQPAPGPPPDLTRHDFLIVATTAMSLLDVLGGYPIADFPSRARIDGEAAGGLADVLLGYRKVYRAAGAASLLGPVCGTLSLLAEMAPTAGSSADVIVSLIGQAASLAGVILMFDERKFAESARYLAIAARAAQQSSDDELLAITLACRAFHSAYSGAPSDGLAFAAEALQIADRKSIHPRSHGWVAAVTSEMHATLGEHTPCMHALDVAEGQLSGPMPAEPWKGIGAFTGAKLTAYRGGDLMRLGRYREAQIELQAALAQLGPGLAKHRCTAYIDLADAYARDGEPDQAARHAISALDIIAYTRHADSLRRVGALNEMVRRSGTAIARELHSKLLEVRAAT